MPAEFTVVVPESVSDELASITLVNSVTSRTVVRAVEELRSAAAAPDGAPLVVSAAASAVGKLIVRQAVDREAALELAARHPELLAVHAAYPLDQLRDAIDAARTNGTGSTLLALS
ncbi:hypothetical protein AB0D49_28555 [Streptomyces sp. NPDC048290]|uniref:hypothetical protein n=1 Tax=Streptomyces sp. NPDC048290 TaxID=3155811 RepID=UPI0034310451